MKALFLDSLFSVLVFLGLFFLVGILFEITRRKSSFMTHYESCEKCQKLPGFDLCEQGNRLFGRDVKSGSLAKNCGKKQEKP